MKKYDQFVCLSGLPRSGSTLLSALLSQNPKIHSEGNSAVCQLMWDLHQSSDKNCKEQITANNRQSTITSLISSIPEIYYNNINHNEKIIVDKCRSWTLGDNVELLKKYIDANIKIIVLERPIVEIVNSFVKLYNKNDKKIIAETYLTPKSEPIMRSLNGIINAKLNNKDNNFLFLCYKELVENPDETIRKIYDFCGWDYFPHDFNNIVPRYVENDEVYGLKGFHDVLPYIKLEKSEIILEQNIINHCNEIDYEIKRIFNNL